MNVSVDSVIGPWVAIGDFYSIISQDEKLGGKPFTCSSSTGLGHFMEEKGMVDLGFLGNIFTWDNGNDDHTNIKQRLDRGIANIAWQEFFPKAVVEHQPITTSDHAPILLNTVGERCRKSRSFKFEAMWVRDPGYGLIVENS